ncbi:hypothetical protein [Geobacter pickeringii]|uniref:Lipoprotein n=1 Tax=Geobacter pickeringii TaxID=345632 RepID=A0A0B5BDM2_9BACT|nr:hypothetical protein [Geobacter pickeringii]AJE04803.1 hypothetical protein GPICK_03835 [Geobacter pickeringii]
MKRIMGAILVGFAIMLAGCGSEVQVSATVPVVVPVVSGPGIDSMSFSLDTARHFVVGAVNFSAPHADLDSMTIVVADNRGQEVARTLTDLRSFAGYAAGTISFSIDYIAYLPGTYTFTLYLTDRTGLLSNPVYGTFVVI